MPYWVYILQSETSGRYYCGQTCNVKRRIREHNDPDYSGKKWTKKFQGPWRLLKEFSCPSRADAVILEKKIKQRGIERYLLDIQPAESRRRSGLTTLSGVRIPPREPIKSMVCRDASLFI
jgi:putative endonuclease